MNFDKADNKDWKFISKIKTFVAQKWIVKNQGNLFNLNETSEEWSSNW